MNSKTTRPDHRITVMTWNIRHGRGNEGVVDLDRIAAVIEASGADIVGLQEVDRGGARSGRIDQAAHLAELLDTEARFAPNATFDPGDDQNGPHLYGVAILSRYPIVATQHRLLVNGFGWEQRGALAVSIDIGGQLLTVVNTHLQWAGDDNEEACARQRARQVEEVVALFHESGAQAVVMGDFNSRPGSPEMAAIESPSSGLSDAWTTVHGEAAGYTIPSHPIEEAASRIDYLFVGAGLRVQTIEVFDTDLTRMASDHYPVVTTFELTGNSAISPAAPPVT